MRIQANNQNGSPNAASELVVAVEQKIDEVAFLLNGQRLNDAAIQSFRKKFDSALQNCEAGEKAIDAFKVIDEKTDASREELLDEFTTLLLSNKVDSRAAGKYLQAKKISNLLLILIALAMVTLGIAMIIIPAPPYFEMFTIYNFTRDDGITLMDVISGIIVLIGLYILTRTLYKKPQSYNYE